MSRSGSAEYLGFSCNVLKLGKAENSRGAGGGGRAENYRGAGFDFSIGAEIGARAGAGVGAGRGVTSNTSGPAPISVNS